MSSSIVVFDVGALPDHVSVEIKFKIKWMCLFFGLGDLIDCMGNFLLSVT